MGESELRTNLKIAYLSAIGFATAAIILSNWH
jgi:hypothetical protein